MNMNMKYSGFTLVELMITLGVLSILLVLGVPQFSNSTANSRLTTAINSLSGDLAFARTEAVKRSVTVTVAAVNPADWAGGWKVTAGTDLRISPALSGNATIAASAASVNFLPTGRTNSAAALTFSLCDNRAGAFGKRVTLNSTGQTFLETRRTCP